MQKITSESLKNNISICDFEVLKDYISFQFSFLNTDKIEVIECYSDTELMYLQKYLEQNFAGKLLFFYNLGYDLEIIKALFENPKISNLYSVSQNIIVNKNHKYVSNQNKYFVDESKDIANINNGIWLPFRCKELAPKTTRRVGSPYKQPVGSLKDYGAMFGYPEHKDMIDFASNPSIHQLDKKKLREYQELDILVAKKIFKEIDVENQGLPYYDIYLSLFELAAKYVDFDEYNFKSWLYSVENNTLKLFVNEDNKAQEYLQTKQMLQKEANRIGLEFNPVFDSKSYSEKEDSNFMLKNGREVNLGMGGLHSVNENEVYKSDSQNIIIDSDFSSFYPATYCNSAIFEDVLHVDKLKKLVKERILNKKTNPKLASVQKLLLNSFYGKFEYLINHATKRDVKYYGYYVAKSCQYKIIELIKLLEDNIPNINIFYVNTDGITSILPRQYQDKYYEICRQYLANLAGYDLEHTTYSCIYLKDVNNYFAYDGSKIKGKGIFKDYNGQLIKSLVSLPYPRQQIISWVEEIQGSDSTLEKLKSESVNFFCWYEKSKKYITFNRKNIRSGEELNTLFNVSDSQENELIPFKYLTLQNNFINYLKNVVQNEDNFKVNKIKRKASVEADSQDFIKGVKALVLYGKHVELSLNKFYCINENGFLKLYAKNENYTLKAFPTDLKKQGITLVKEKRIGLYSLSEFDKDNLTLKINDILDSPYSRFLKDKENKELPLFEDDSQEEKKVEKNYKDCPSCGKKAKYIITTNVVVHECFSQSCGYKKVYNIQHSHKFSNQKKEEQNLILKSLLDFVTNNDKFGLLSKIVEDNFELMHAHTGAGKTYSLGAYCIYSACEFLLGLRTKKTVVLAGGSWDKQSDIIFKIQSILKEFMQIMNKELDYITLADLKILDLNSKKSYYRKSKKTDSFKDYSTYIDIFHWYLPQFFKKVNRNEDRLHFIENPNLYTIYIDEAHDFFNKHTLSLLTKSICKKTSNENILKFEEFFRVDDCVDYIYENVVSLHTDSYYGDSEVYQTINKVVNKNSFLKSSIDDSLQYNKIEELPSLQREGNLKRNGSFVLEKVYSVSSNLNIPLFSIKNQYVFDTFHVFKGDSKEEKIYKQKEELVVTFDTIFQSKNIRYFSATPSKAMEKLKKIEVQSENKIDVLRIVHRRGLDMSTLLRNIHNKKDDQDFSKLLLVYEKKVDDLKKYHENATIDNTYISKSVNLLVAKKLSENGVQEEYTTQLGERKGKPSIISVSGEISSGSDLRDYKVILIEGEGRIHLSQRIADSIDGETRVKQALGRITREDNGIKYAIIPTEYNLDFDYLSNLAKKIEVFDFELGQFVNQNQYSYNPKSEYKNSKIIELITGFLNNN